jgi:hypothetical protein
MFTFAPAIYQAFQVTGRLSAIPVPYQLCISGKAHAISQRKHDIHNGEMPYGNTTTTIAIHPYQISKLAR